MTTIETGSGPKSWPLYDLWIANGRPEQIVVAAYGPATCKIDGFRWTAVRGEGCAAGALKLREEGGRLIGQPAGAVMPAAVLALDPSLLRVVQYAAGVSLATFGVEWWTAARWARLGSWTRRKAWADTTRQMRFEAGHGTTNAVAVYEGGTITKRVVRNSDFGAVEFRAVDWIVPDAPAEIDLTDSILSASGIWNLTHGGGGTTGGGGGGGGGSGGGGTNNDEIIDGVTDGIDLATSCALGMTHVMLDIARAFAIGMAAAVGDDSARRRTELLAVGITSIILSNGSAACAGYYRDYILSLVMEAASGSGSGSYPLSQWHHGETNPANDIGKDGDYYLTAWTPFLYTIYFKEGGVWVPILGE